MTRPFLGSRTAAVAAVFVLGLTVAPTVFAAEAAASSGATDPSFSDSSLPRQMPAWQNPSAVVPWAVNRDGADEPTDPHTGIALPGTAQDLGD